MISSSPISSLPISATIIVLYEVTGVFELAQDTSVFVYDKAQQHFEIDQQFSTAFSGDLILGATGAFESSSATSVEFVGNVDIIGALNISGSTVPNFTGVVGITGSFVITQDTISTVIGVVGSTGAFELNLESAYDFKSTSIVGSITTSIDTSYNFSGFENITGSIIAESLTEVLFAGLVTGLSTATGDLASVVPTLCMNTKTVGVSEYTNYNFNSFFKIGQDYYGCSSAGLFKLTGSTDNTVAVSQSVIRSAASDFGEQRFKSVRDCYVYLRSTDDTSIRLITNEQVDRDGYPIYYDGIDGLHRRRVKVAQGIRGTTWQVEFKNESGSDFTLKQVDVIPATLNRSI